MSSEHLVANLLRTIVDTKNEDSEGLSEAIAKLLSLTISPDALQKQKSLMEIAKSYLLTQNGYCYIWFYDRYKSVLYPHILSKFDEKMPYPEKLKDIIIDVIEFEDEEILSKSAIDSLTQALDFYNKKYQGIDGSQVLDFNTYLTLMIYNEEVGTKEFMGIFHLHTRKNLFPNCNFFLQYLVGGLSRTTIRVRDKNIASYTTSS